MLIDCNVLHPQNALLEIEVTADNSISVKFEQRAKASTPIIVADGKQATLNCEQLVKAAISTLFAIFLASSMTFSF